VPGYSDFIANGRWEGVDDVPREIYRGKIPTCNFRASAATRLTGPDGTDALNEEPVVNCTRHEFKESGAVVDRLRQ